MKSAPSCPDDPPLTGEVLPPEPDRDEALRFLAKHGVKPVRVKSYRSIEEVAAILAAETGTSSREDGQ
jgi:hypothetical protein